jgi:hypothetical protein
VNFFFEGDGNLTRSGCCFPTILTIDGGTMEKTGGTNSFNFDPNIVINSTNGTLAADSGTLVLPGNNSFYTNGGFNVASNATIALVPAGHNVSFAGNFSGAGQGTVLLSAGTLNAAPGSLTLNVPAPLFQWTGGTLSGLNPLTNSGTMEVSTTNSVRLLGILDNSGLLHHSGAGNLAFSEEGSGTRFENLPSAVYWLESDASLAVVDCCSPTFFDNYGVFRKSGGTGNSVISPAFNNLGGTIAVESGTLTLANNGSSSNGTLNVSSGATLDITGGGQPAWAGQMNGTGGGTVLLRNGTLYNANATLNFADGLFQLAGGILSGPLTNVGVLGISGTNDSKLANTIYNVGLMRHTSTTILNFSQGGAGTVLWNLPGADFRFENDGFIDVADCCAATYFENEGLLQKSGGTNESRINNVNFNNLGGTIDVESGRLTLASSGTSSNGMVTVSAGSILDLTGGRAPTWAGLLSGSGAGRVQLNSGSINATPSLTLNFAPGVFQWLGGRFNGAVSNRDAVEITGPANASINGIFENSGLMRHTGVFDLELSEVSGTRFQNLSGGTFQFENTGGVSPVDCCAAVNFDNFGLVTKIANVSNVVFSASLNNLGGTIDVEAGTLTLANSGSSSNGLFTVSAGATLDVTGGAQPSWAGVMTGRGTGTVLMSSGTLNAGLGVTLDLTNNLFQWTGGSLSGSFSNLNVLTLSGSGSHRLLGRMDNAGLVRHTDVGTFALSQGPGTIFRNLPGATYQFETNSSITVVDCCASTVFENDGLVRKAAGSGNTVISAPFNNNGGTNEVDAGQLTFSGGGASSNGTFIVASGAVVDLTGGSQPFWRGQLFGTGGGQVQMNNGIIQADNLIVNCAPGVFQLNGGRFNGTLTNAGEMHISGGSLAGAFYNAGVVRQVGAAAFSLSEVVGTTFHNLPGATYEFQANGNLTPVDCCSAVTFENAGLLRKSGSLIAATISTGFTNLNGSIEVDSGTLSVSGGAYAQGTGAFTVQLGGTNAGEWGEFIAGGVSLGGSLSVKLTNGFAPQIGQQFQILSSTGLSGTFSSLDVPAGIQVNYSATGIFLVITGQVSSAQSQSTVASPTLTITRGQNQATLQWLADSNLILESTTNLVSGASWMPFTNVPWTLSNGTFNTTLPATNTTRFFRLRSH